MAVAIRESSSSSSASHFHVRERCCRAMILAMILSCFCKAIDTSLDIKLSDEAQKNVTIACSATRFEKLCREYVLNSPDVVQAAAEPVRFVKLSIKLALREVNNSLAKLEKLKLPARSRRLFLEDTQELLQFSHDLLTSSMNEDLTTNGSLSNVRHWLSAALTYNNDCEDFLSRSAANLAHNVRNVSIPLLSNALWILDAFSSSKDTFELWPRPSDRHQEQGRLEILENWHQYTQQNQNGLMDIGTAIPSAVVCHEPGFGSHTSIQAAVDGAPDHLSHRYVIYIRPGIYDEIVRIPSTKTMLAFIGSGINQTIITGNLTTSMNMSTYRTATLAVTGNGFLARDLTVVNTAGPDAQAVAMRVDSDMAAFHRCSFWGFQDTLYTHAYRQFYKECSIYGTVDFIFGNAASVFQNCNIQVRPGGENKTTSTITAQGRTDPAQDTAFVCQSCWVASTPEYMVGFMKNPRRHVAFLGRPWKPYARAIFIESYLDVIVEPSGWMEWNGTEGLATTTLAEFRNYGPGANPGGRVGWSKQLTTMAALQYSVRGLIQGGFWLPFTGIPYRLVF